jgi:hypothetical protein
MKTTEERKKMTMKQAMRGNTPLFMTECCNGCGKEACRLYIQLEGTYAGTRYCRSCALEALKGEYF